MEAQTEMNLDAPERIKAIAAEIFGLNPASVELSMGPDDIDRWDSLNHLRLITDFEQSFNLRLAMQQIQEIRSLSDLASFVSQNRC